MKTHSWLRHVSTRASGSVDSAPRSPSARIWATRGILILGLVLGNIGAAVSAASGHVSTGHAPASSVSTVNKPAYPWMW
jgi:hypothetical protein